MVCKGRVSTARVRCIDSKKRTSKEIRKPIKLEKIYPTYKHNNSWEKALLVTPENRYVVLAV